MPLSNAALARHTCIRIRQDDAAYGVWRLTRGRGAAQKAETVRVRGNLIPIDGEIAVRWVLNGRGMPMRAEWGLPDYLREDQLVHVVPRTERRPRISMPFVRRIINFQRGFAHSSIFCQDHWRRPSP